MKNILFAFFVVVFFPLNLISQTSEQTKSKDVQKTYSESVPYKIGDNRSRTNKPKKVNPKKEAKKKARETKRLEKAAVKREKAARKSKKKFAEKNKEWLENETIVRADTTYVSIPLTVYGKDGLPILDIKEEELKVFENGEKQNTLRFGKSQEPNTIILLFDLSPSAGIRKKEIRSTLKKFIEKMDSKDRIMIVGFDQVREILVGPTNDRAKVARIITKMKYGSGTSIYDAVDQLCSEWLPKIGGRKTILLFSDGVDTTSVNSNYRRSIIEAQRSNVPIFSIRYNTRADYTKNRKKTSASATESLLISILKRSRPGVFLNIRGVGAGMSAAEYKTGSRYMSDLSFASGGRVFNAGVSVSHLENAFSAVYGAIKSQNYIEYRSSLTVPTDGVRRIRVRINRPNLIVHIRDTYFPER